jgi:3-isopropylmalate/(R)-2-methylmalate dehydratase small subunit
VELPGILRGVKQGEEIEVDLKSGRLTNLSTGVELEFEPIPPFLLETLDAGGMIPFLKKEVDQGRLPRRLERRLNET